MAVVRRQDVICDLGQNAVSQNRRHRMVVVVHSSIGIVYMMTRPEQRSLMTRYGASRLNGATPIVLRALITSNKLAGKRDDAEKPFRVGLTKLQKRVGRDQRTITRHFQILENEKLLTVTKNKNGTSNTYSLHLSPMKEWISTDEADMLKRQQRAAAKLKWKRKDKVAKTDLENIHIVDGCVKGCIKDETNRERRLRQHRLITVETI